MGRALGWRVAWLGWTACQPMQTNDMSGDTGSGDPCDPTIVGTARITRVSTSGDGRPGEMVWVNDACGHAMTTGTTDKTGSIVVDVPTNAIVSVGRNPVTSFYGIQPGYEILVPDEPDRATFGPELTVSAAPAEGAASYSVGANCLGRDAAAVQRVFDAPTSMPVYTLSPCDETDTFDILATATTEPRGGSLISMATATGVAVPPKGEDVALGEWDANLATTTLLATPPAGWAFDGGQSVFAVRNGDYFGTVSSSPTATGTAGEWELTVPYSVGGFATGFLIRLFAEGADDRIIDVVRTQAPDELTLPPEAFGPMVGITWNPDAADGPRLDVVSSGDAPDYVSAFIGFVPDGIEGLNRWVAVGPADLAAWPVPDLPLTKKSLHTPPPSAAATIDAARTEVRIYSWDWVEGYRASLEMDRNAAPPLQDRHAVIVVGEVEQP